MESGGYVVKVKWWCAHLIGVQPWIQVLLLVPVAILPVVPSSGHKVLLFFQLMGILAPAFIVLFSIVGYRPTNRGLYVTLLGIPCRLITWDRVECFGIVHEYMNSIPHAKLVLTLRPSRRGGRHQIRIRYTMRNESLLTMYFHAPEFGNPFAEEEKQ